MFPHLLYSLNLMKGGIGVNIVVPSLVFIGSTSKYVNGIFVILNSLFKLINDFTKSMRLSIISLALTMLVLLSLVLFRYMILSTNVSK